MPILSNFPNGNSTVKNDSITIGNSTLTEAQLIKLIYLSDSLVNAEEVDY